nr:MAG TPA: hypothetical protein [Bacteriophage sp.]
MCGIIRTFESDPLINCCHYFYFDNAKLCILFQMCK